MLLYIRLTEGLKGQAIINEIVAVAGVLEERGICDAYGHLNRKYVLPESHMKGIITKDDRNWYFDWSEYNQGSGGELIEAREFVGGLFDYTR